MTIFTLAKLAESRDPETGEHLERVRSYCRVIARHLQGYPILGGPLDDEYVGLIYQTSPLHDIGKVAIPDSILLKPGRLTAEEFEVMKTHTTCGAATLEAALKRYPDTPFLEMAREIALGHHERYDGRGYPRRTGRRRHPAVRPASWPSADVYDALTSRRVYKEAYSHGRAKSMITASSGRHFDPAMIEAFLAQEQQFVAIREQFAETNSHIAANDELEPTAATRG